MRAFRCTYRESGGKIVVERLQADTQAQLIEMLSAKGCLILSIVEEAGGTADATRARGKKKVKQDDIILFVRQFATMIDAGLPLMQCLQTLEDQAEPGRFRDTLHLLVEDVTRGRSFSEGLANHPKVFDKLFVNMVRAGETGGFLAEILERLATYMESASALKRKVKAAMMYPLIVLAIAIGVTVLLIVKVIPVFEKMFQDFNAQLPLPTRFLIATSHLLRGYGIFVLVGVVGFFFVAHRYVNTPRGRYQFDRLKFALPVFGALNQKVCVARFASTLATLVESGVPIIRSLEIVAETSGNELINQVLRNAMQRTEKGEPIADALRGNKFIPRMVAKMIEVGENTGRLDQMLQRIGVFYTEQVNTAVGGLTAMIEPLMIVFLGVVIGGIMLSMFLPIFQLSQVVS
jgi:type IV pilus assembly protein PilC